MQRIEPAFLLLPPIRPGWRAIAALLIGYVFLDWASYIHPLHGLNITPWNPAPALGLLFLLRYGRRMLLPLALAIFTADVWVRSLPLSLQTSIGLSLLLAVGYLAIAEVLRRRLSSAGAFNDRRGLIEWMAIVSLGTLVNSIVFASVLSLARLIPAGAAQEVFFHYWIGDGVGVLVSMPILWMLIEERGRLQLLAMLRSWEAPVYLLATGLALWLTFGQSEAGGADFKYFFILFMPVVWAAARQGLAGAIFSAAIVQAGIITSVQFLGFSTMTLLEIQVLAAEMALFGFFVGVIVDEKLKVSAELRQTLRLAAAGEMAGALAHELNQPLTALSAYGSACQTLLEQGETGERLRDAIRRMVSESHRAADVVRRLRDFFRTGDTRLEATALTELLDAAAHPFAGKALQHGVDFAVDSSPGCMVLVDRLQIEVVLRNLLSNAFEAVAGQGSGERRVRLSAKPESAGRVCIRVEDSGPGLSGKSAARIFEAFHSSKASGLGLGLVISRAIVEAHGGHLWADVADHGLFRLLLPTEGKIVHANPAQSAQSA